MNKKARNFRVARKAIQLHEVTDSMLVHVRKAADSSWLAQTVWPARFYGKDYVGHDCLVISGAAVMDRRPVDAAKDSDALFTVLPSQYLSNQALALEDHREGNCNAGMCYFPHTF